MSKNLLKLVLASLAAIVMTSNVSAQNKSFKDENIEQRFNMYTQMLSPEKLYLHTDREVYCVGDTLWFKGYLKNASEYSDFPACNYIYVELISSMVEKNLNTGKDEDVDDVRVRVKVKRDLHDAFQGYVIIPDNLNTGIAKLRGYTYWMLNRHAEYMFYKDIEIRNPMKDDFVENLVNSDVRDTYKYTDAGVANPFARTRPEKKKLDIQFLPESGRYIYGHKSVIGVKVLDEQGLGAEVTGEVFADDKSIGIFSTNRLGMGSMEVRLDSPAKKLYANVSDNDNYDVQVDFPAPESRGVIISVRTDLQGVTTSIFTKDVEFADSTFVVVYDRSEMYFKEPFSAATSRFRMSYDKLSPGINNIAVVDKKGNVYAEREFFVFPKETPELKLNLDQEEYGPRQKVSCIVDGEAGNYSVAVSDDKYAPYSGKGYNIISYYYLGSEFKTFVEDSQSYFDESRPLAERIASVDMLMLTQGWKYYELPQILKGETPFPPFGKEYSQSISGVVKGSFKTAKKSIVSFVAPSIHFAAMGQLDTNGWFELSGLDFPDKTQFLVSAVTLGGNPRRFTPYLNDDIFAKYIKYPQYLDKVKYSQDYKYDALQEFYNSTGGLMYSLNASYVTGSRVRRQQNISPFPNFNFKEGQYRSEAELAVYSGMDLMTYIVTTCPPLRFGEVAPSGENSNINQTEEEGTETTITSEDTISSSNYDPSSAGRTIVCRTKMVSTQMSISGGWEEIIVYVNGMRSSCAEIDFMNVSDIEGFAYIHGSDAAMFNTDLDDMLTPRAVIMVKTKQLEHDYATNVSSGRPIGWQKPLKMYSPRYDTYQSKKLPEAMRSTLYWQPNMDINDDGESGFDFYTSDHKVPYTVIVEGVTRTGKPVFATTKITR